MSENIKKHKKSHSSWNQLLRVVMKLPGVKQDRKAFLSEALSPYCTEQQVLQAISTSPVGVVPTAILDKAADECISSHTLKVTLISTAAGMPGGWALAATIPTDIAQYYFHTFAVAQKLAYLYGWPDLSSDADDDNTAAANMMTVFVGSMSGVAAANEVINYVAKQLAESVIKEVSENMIEQTVSRSIISRIARSLGRKLSSESAAKTFGKIVPLVGGLISGGITLATFRPQAKRLKTALQKACRKDVL